MSRNVDQTLMDLHAVFQERVGLRVELLMCVVDTGPRLRFVASAHQTLVPPENVKAFERELRSLFARLLGASVEEVERD